MGASTPRAIRLWAWVVCALTLAAVVVGAAAFVVTGHAVAMAVGLLVPWLATAVLGGLRARPGVHRFLRAYAYVALGAALVGFLATSEDLGDRAVFAVACFVFPPMVLLYLGAGSEWFFTATAVATAALLMGAIALFPIAVLRRWARFAAVRDLVWIAWAASLALAAGIAAYVEENMDAMVLLPVAAVVALLGLWAPIHLAREAGYVEDPADDGEPAARGAAAEADDA